MWNPDGSGRHAPVNLSTASSNTSSAVLSSVRAERLAREAQRERERAATVVQRVWRGRSAAAAVQEDVLGRCERGEVGDVARGAGALLVLLGSSRERPRVAKVLEAWCAAAVAVDESGQPAFAAPLGSGNAEYRLVFALLCSRILRFVSVAPRTTLAVSLLGALELFLRPSAYASLSAAERVDFVDAIGSSGWVESAVKILQDLVAASPPKKKHPLLQPVVRLITAPLAISQATTASPFTPSYLQLLLAVPSLPSVIPLASLTYLSSTLPLFSVLIPAAAKDVSLLSQRGLSTELGRTYFLANLATFGITGGMLARNGAKGMSDWIRVVGTVLGSLGEGWGRAAEGRQEDDPVTEVALAMESESEDDVAVPARPPKPPAREPLPANIGSKLLLLASPAHLGTVTSIAINSSIPSLLGDLSTFILAILTAFRGSSRWEGTLDAVSEGKRGQALVKLLWREGVRGKWGDGYDAWATFQQNPSKPALLLLSHLYCHYLLLTPDDEFFARETNALTTDEVLELSSIWRDLAFWGYLNGVGTTLDRGVGTEEVRALFTRGVTRVCERNARHKFAVDGFWVMNTDLRGFVGAVKYEDQELEAAKAPMLANGPRLQRGGRHISRRQIAYIAPRLGLLNNLPMAVPFQTRLEVFREFVKADRERLGIDDNYFSRQNRHGARVRRTHLSEDGFRQLNELGPALKGRIQIEFIDQWGQAEAGIDGGGLFKEFLNSLSKEAFDTERGLWLANYNNELYPNPHSYAKEPHQLNWYSFIGRVLGKALYDDILVDVKFADFFLARWLGRQSYLDDLASLDKELYHGLIQLKNYTGNFEELSLNFTVTEEDFGVNRSVPLVPGGADLSVTSENRHEYIQLMCRYKLDRQFAEQSRAFFAGLSDLIDPKWLRMFDQQELAQLLCGEETPIDLTDLRKHTLVSGYSDSKTAQLFWKVVGSFTQDERRALLRFVTGCSRPPLLGFQYLNPQFAIRKSSDDVERLPTASSCANLLKLPDYKDEQRLKQKLLQAINSGTGFHLS